MRRILLLAVAMAASAVTPSSATVPPLPEPRALLVERPSTSALYAARTVTAALEAAYPGLPETAPAAPLSLEAEVRLLAERTGRVAPARMPALPAEVRTGLRLLLAGLREAEAVRATALSGPIPAGADRLLVEGADARSWRLGAPWSEMAVDRDAMLRATSITARALDATVEALGNRVRTSTLCGYPTGGPTTIGSLIALDLDGTNSTYTQAYAVTIDLGGCDTYEVAAGANGLAGNPVGVSIDLGLEADRYHAATGTYALGGAQAGIAALVDDGGQDIYTSSALSTLGGGTVGGIGLLADLGGDDQYLFSGAGGGFGAHGVGVIGLGALVDLDGDDVYRYEFDPGEAPAGFSRLLSMQGAGGVGGIGILADAYGDDRYEVDTVGNAVTSSGQGAASFAGVGVLADATGDDEYLMHAKPTKADGGATGGVSGQGSASLDAVAVLADGSGNDSYTLATDSTGDASAAATAMGQGAGLGAVQWWSAGSLIDGAGDDTYTARAAASGSIRTEVVLAQGAGYSQGEGALVDLGGDDTYTLDAATAGGQGAGWAAGSLGALVDRTGNDVYVGGSEAQGFGGEVADESGFWIPGGTGLFIDGAGIDSISERGSAAAWQAGSNGLGAGFSGGNGHVQALRFADWWIDMFGGRPRPAPTVTIDSPSDGAPVGSTVLVRGTADAGGLPVDAVEVSVDGGPWRLATKTGTWSAWTASVEGLTIGTHTIAVRAWAAGIDSAAATVRVETVVA